MAQTASSSQTITYTTDAGLRLVGDAWGASDAIRIKLSIDSFRTRDGFVLLTYVLVQDLHGCPSFSRSLGRQTCGGGTHMDEEAAQGEFGLKDSLPPTRCEGLAMPHQFQQTPFTLSLRPEVCPSLGAEGRIEHNEQHATIEIT